MITRGFMDIPNDPTKDPLWFQKPISEVQSLVRPIQDHLVDEKTTIADAIKQLKEKNIDVLLSFNNG